MSYVVTSGHVECLKSGRMVAPGDDVTNAEAKQNPRLTARGVLREREARKPKKAETKPPVKPESKTPASETPEKEDDR